MFHLEILQAKVANSLVYLELCVWWRQILPARSKIVSYCRKLMANLNPNKE